MLSRLARDLLSVPATGAGVERLFNTARDICHYRRGSLNESTIQDLMMYMFSEKFSLDAQQGSGLEPHFAESSRQETLEEDEALSNQEDFDPISDDEEDAPERTDGHSFPSEQTYRAVIEVAGAIPGNGNEQNMSEEETDEMPRLPPPVTQLGGRAQRRSGRATMLSSRLQGYELY